MNDLTDFSSNPKSSAEGASVLAEFLQAYEVTHIFMVPAILRRTMMELERRTSIARIHAHGEKAAAYMADGYARSSSKPGVCAAQVVGAMNLAAGLRDAWLAHAPVIALTGGSDPRTRFRHVYQEVEDRPSFATVTKYSATVDDVSRIPELMRQAFRSSTTGCPGPVHLQFGGNEGQIDAESSSVDSVVEPAFRRVPPFRPSADDSHIQEAAKHLIEAKRPVIVAGGGARWSNASHELLEVAERFQIPVATSLNGKDLIPATNPYSVGVVGSYSRECANKIVSEADLVCFVGSSAGGMTTHFWSLPRPGTPVIQIDIEPSALGKHYPTIVSINSDAQLALRRLLRFSDGIDSEKRSSWMRRVSELREEWEQKYRSTLLSDEIPTCPERICSELTRLLPDDGILVVDTGHAGMWMGQFFDVRSNNQQYLRSCGHLGWAFPAGLGAKCAQPNRPVVVFTGDAGLWYHLGELETAVRWRINTVTIVNNNSGGNQSKRGFDRVYEGLDDNRSRELWTYSDVDFAQVARSVGAFGIRVETPSEFQVAFKKALAANRPAIIDVKTDMEVVAPQVWSPAS